LPKDEQTSKHGGGGRYNAIWSSRGEINNIYMSIKKKKKRVYKICEKRKIYI
jgi:hypothetical protein